MTENNNQELWYTMFALGHPALMSFQRFHRLLPSSPRCKLCLAPFKGVGSWLMAIKGKAPSSKNPRYCSACDKFLRAFPGGAEVQMSMIFVDVRASSALAEKLTPLEFSRAMNVFYSGVTKVLHNCDGFVIDIVGDEVVSLFPPGFSGKDHAQKAILAAEQLLELRIVLAGSGTPIQFGVGVNTGVAYIGTITGAEVGLEDVRALGDQVNITSRLASMAAGGEALISEATVEAIGGLQHPWESRSVNLKGRATPLQVRVARTRSCISASATTA